MPYTLHDIAEIVSGKISGNSELINHKVKQLLIDSRMLINPKEVIFIALKTATGNGHQYISSLYEKQVLFFLVEEEVALADYPTAVFITVNNTLEALQKLGAYHRKKLAYPIIGITGSNGKTIVKEWLYQLLSPDYNVLRSPGSYNSQIGVPLSLWNLHEQCDIAIIEAGVSKAGDMAALEEMIRPDIGIFTTIGDAHSAGFRNLEEKIEEKFTLFRNVKQLFVPIYEANVEHAFNHWKASADPQAKYFLTGNTDQAHLKILSRITHETGTVLHAEYEGKQIELQTGFTTPEISENIITCWAVMLTMNYDQQTIQERISSLVTLPMRLEIIHGINNCTIINDAYSADKESFKAALKLLEDQKQHERLTVIMGSMEGSSDEGVALYSPMLENMKMLGISRVFFIGNNRLPEIEGIAVFQYHDRDAFIKAFPDLSFKNEAILIKGARKHRLEDIIPLLQLRLHQTVLEINLDVLANNIRIYKAWIGKDIKMMAMVKAFSYGSGSYEIARVLEKQQVDYLGVAYVDEGIALRKSGIRIPIMVMNTDFAFSDALLKYNLEPVVFSKNALLAVISFARKTGSGPIPTHLELDTGMHRLGIEKNELQEILPLLNDEHILLKSVFTHLAASEDPEMDDFTNTQLADFEEMTDFIGLNTRANFLKHALNSAGIIRHPRGRYEMVRLGLGMYGITSGENTPPGLDEISVWKTTISQLRTVQKGETVGYNRKGRIDQTGTIATVSIGYADGYPVQAGEGKAYMLVNGKKAPVVGKVCMDMTMIDVTGIPNLHEGCEVIVFGRGLAVKTLASLTGTIPYDILTAVASRVKRVYFHS